MRKRQAGRMVPSFRERLIAHTVHHVAGKCEPEPVPDAFLFRLHQVVYLDLG